MRLATRHSSYSECNALIKICKYNYMVTLITLPQLKMVHMHATCSRALCKHMHEIFYLGLSKKRHLQLFYWTKVSMRTHRLLCAGWQCKNFMAGLHNPTGRFGKGEEKTLFALAANRTAEPCAPSSRRVTVRTDLSQLPLEHCACAIGLLVRRFSTWITSLENLHFWECI
jgi:hypothetical protein